MQYTIPVAVITMNTMRLAANFGVPLSVLIRPSFAAGVHDAGWGRGSDRKGFEWDGWRSVQQLLQLGNDFDVLDCLF